MNNETDATRKKVFQLTWDYLFDNSKVELWSLTLFLFFSLAASLIRILQKRRNGGATGVTGAGTAEIGAASGRSTDEVDGNGGRATETTPRDDGENDEGCGGDDSGKRGGGTFEPIVRWSRGRASWRW